MAINPSTPVIVGVGQFTERVDTPGFQRMSAVDLAAAAVRAALIDSGADSTAVLAAVDVVVGLRQFENSAPVPTPLGRSNNLPRSVMGRLGAQPRHAVLEPVGGHGPQKLVTEFGGTIARGGCGVVVIVGSEAGASTRHFAKREPKPNFTETVDGQLEDRGYGIDDYTDEYILRHGLTSPPVYYGLMDNARRARIGLGVQEYRQEMAKLFAPMSAVAARNPYSSFPLKRSVAELTAVGGENRMLCDPYTRLLVARDEVNQGAAVIMMSVGSARRLGVPVDKWVYLHGHADLKEQSLLVRTDLSRSPATVAAVAEALDVAGIGLHDVATFDLYSCFPFPVFAVCDELGIAVDDPRGLTLTGGLPYFGGPGNSYSLHAIAETVSAMRAAPDQFGLVGASGGIMSYYSAGVYSARTVDWTKDGSVLRNEKIAAQPQTSVTTEAQGAATVETYTVRHRLSGPPRGIIVGRLHADDSRFLATTVDEDLMCLMTDGDPLGAELSVRPTGGVNCAVLA